MTEEISKQVLEKIKQEEIKPCSKWKFALKNYFMWGLFTVALIVGSLAVSVIIFSIKISDWDMHRELVGGPVKFLIVTLSYFWLLIFAAFVVVAYYNFRQTKKGYKYNIYVVVGITLLVTVLLGGFSYAFGFGEKMENIMTRKAPFYKGVQHNRQMMWNQAEKGLLGGRIVEVGENMIDLEDAKRGRWHVTVSTTQIMPMVIIREGNMIRIVGQKTDHDCFEAKRIMPWKRQGGPGKQIRFIKFEEVKEKTN